jgi:hypothetical protein
MKTKDQVRNGLSYFFGRGLVLSILLMTIMLQGEEAAQVLRKLSETEYTLDKVKIDTGQRELRFPAEVNMEEGLVELILCGRKGKLHESVLKTEIVPSHLQVALLLLDFNYGSAEAEYNWQGPVAGDSLYIWADWQKEDGGMERHRIEELVWNVQREAPMQNTHWVLWGSEVIDGNYMADVEESIITTYRNNFTIIENPLETGMDDTLYEVNKDLIPARGTEVTVIIKGK